MADDNVEEVFEEELAIEEWAIDESGPSLVSRMVAEVLGTFILVFMGVGAALFFGTDGLTVAFGFAIGVMIAALIFGGISGAHLNPAVTVGVWVAGRFPGRDVAPYVLSQLVGAILAGGAIFAVLSSHPQIADPRGAMSAGSNGFGEHSPQFFELGAAIGVEIIIAALLVSVVCAVTSARAKAGAVAAPFGIGLTVGFLVMIAIPITNGALNPARASGTALWSDSWALEQLWVFWVAPLIGAALAGLAFRFFGPEEDLIAMEVVETVEVIED